MTWWGTAAKPTLESYGVDDPERHPAEHLDWMRSLPLQSSDPHRLFVHAGDQAGYCAILPIS